MDVQGEIRRLRRALGDLAALSTIPAAGADREPAAVADGLADVLVRGFQLDFAFVRLCDPDGRPAVEATRGETWQGFPEWLDRRLTGEAPLSRPEIVPVVGNGPPSFRGVVIPIGVNGEAGLVAAACDRAEFPDETDQLLLSVAANHAATAFQAARLIEARGRAEAAMSRPTTEALATPQRFRDLVNSVGGIVWEADAETLLFSFVSEQAERILEYPTALWLREPTFWSDHIHPDDRDSTVRLRRQASVERRGYASEYRMLTADGRVVWLRDLVALVVEGGRPARLRGVMIDITERKRADEERQARRWVMESLDRVNRAIQSTNDLEQMMSDVLEATLDIFECDRASLVYPCDPDAARYGVRMHPTRPEFPSIFTVGEQVPMGPDTADVLRTVRAAGGPIQFGPERPLPSRLAQPLGIQSALAMALYPKGDQPYVFGLYQCSRPRAWTSQEQFLFEGIARRLEDALTSLAIFHRLRESEQRYRSIFESTGVSIWEQDFSGAQAMLDELKAQGVRDFRAHFAAHRDVVRRIDRLVRVLDVNEATVKMFRAKSKSDLLASLRKLRTRDTRAAMVDLLVNIAEGGTSRGVEITLKDLEGRPLTALSYITFPPTAKGFERLLMTLIDVTERKHAEQRAAQAHAELAHVTRVTLLGEMTASIAHEVNQPLAAIVADANASLNWLADERPDLERVRDALDAIVRDGHRAADVIQRIRQLARKSAPRQDAVDLADVVRDVVLLARAGLHHQEISLVLDLAPELPLVLGDRIQLQQVLLNLVMNGVEAMASVTDRPRQLIIRSEPRDDHVWVAVQDTGIGIAADDLDHVFSAFFTTKPGGMGMGLSISRSIVEAHGGRLWAATNGPHGAVLNVALPMATGVTDPTRRR